MFLWRNKKDISIFGMKKALYLLLCRAMGGKRKDEDMGGKRKDEDEEKQTVKI